MKRKIKGGVLATIGYILSPLSWWNDLLVNIPISYIFAVPFGYISKSLFIYALIFFYWCTNVVGFILMHHGIKELYSKDKSEYTRRELIKDILISMCYTVLVVSLILLRVIKFPTDYLP